MTLLLLCYMCGQGERIRLSTWMLIISVMSYIFLMAGAPVYALDIGVQRTSNGDYIVSNNTVEVSTSTVSVQATKDITQSKMQFSNTKTSINVYLEDLLELQTNFPENPVFKKSNFLLLQIITEKFDGTSIEYQEKFLAKLITGLKSIGNQGLKKYGVYGETLIPMLEFIYSKKEDTTSNYQQNNQVSDSGFSIQKESGEYYLEKDPHEMYKRVNIYLNDKFLSSCEYKQCEKIKLKAEMGDSVKLFINMRSNLEKRATLWVN